jgi:hypothetical protein
MAALLPVSGKWCVSSLWRFSKKTAGNPRPIHSRIAATRH